MRVHCMSKGNCYIPDHDSNSSESPKHILSECIEGAIVADSCLEIRTIFGRQSRIEGRKEPSERSVVSHCTSLQKINPFRIQHTFEVQERVDCPSYPSRRYLLLSPSNLPSPIPQVLQSQYQVQTIIIQSLQYHPVFHVCSFLQSSLLISYVEKVFLGYWRNEVFKIRGNELINDTIFRVR
jgi:hypothetical protein